MTLRLLIFVLFGTYSVTGNGQPADHPNAKLEFLNGYWVLEVWSGNKQANDALRAYYGDERMKNARSEETKTLFKDYVASTITITKDSLDLKMNYVSMDMNSAKAGVKFISPRFENAGKELMCTIYTYNELDDNEVNLVVIDKESRQSATLSPKDNYTKTIHLKAAD